MDAQRASAAKPPTGKKMKARAPPPPGKPAPLDALGQQRPPGSALSLQWNLVPVKEAQRDGPLDITVVLPSGLEKQSVVTGSQAMMDLLVELCLQNHLNPSHHTLEVHASETRQPLSFKPNTPVGTLDVHTVFLKEKVPEDKAKPGPPKAPEKSVRLVVNYLRTQKAVVRVSPEVPLQNILPIICAKCDVSPDHVVLLRDNIGGEELELSKSLRELGVRELYAWDNRGETFRKSSLGNEEANKEKKTFLGFFKASKSSSSKAEQPGLSGVDSEEDTLKPAPGRGLNGCSTTPNSPSMPSRSLTLGPSLSLGNVSGVSLRSEMKKRRAPPPPSAGPPVQDKVSEKVSLGSQMDLQKKKRRAPAPPPPQPPPPSPLVPSRTEDSEEKRKSAVGVGRQVPQKPPRGTARGPPQLVLPPPPPYPPPDTDAAEPLGFPGEGAGSEASDLRRKLSLPLGPTGVDRAMPVPVEAEETASVGSCFASEDTTEDSGVMSSPSDIVSLDSQHDSVKSKDKWATDQEDSSDQDFAGTPELGPSKSPPWDRNGPGSVNPRAGRMATATGDGDGDFLLTGQFQRALVEFEGDMEDMEESYGTDSNSLTSSSTGESHHGAREAPASDGGVDAIPVTFIGEVPDDPLDLGMFCNRNNNAGSFDTEVAASRRAHLSPFQAGHSQPHARMSTEGPDPQSPSPDASPTSATRGDGRSAAAGPLGMAFASRLHADEHNTENDAARGPAYGEKTQATENTRPPALPGKDSRASSVIPAPLAWHQRGQTPGGSYGLRHGLTTYKIVPAKSETRRYDTAGSLSSGAIMIDELGDLVSPHTNTRTIFSAPSPPDADPQPVEKVREFWRCNSVDKPPGPTKRPLPASTSNPASTCTPAPTSASASVVLAQPLHPDGRSRAVNTPTAPRPQSAAQEAGTHLEEGRSRPLSLSVVTCHTQVPATGSTEVTFPRPQRRTSSQYVASAIARRIGPPKAQHHGSSEKGHAGQAPAPAAQPLPAPCLSSETQGQKGSAGQTCVAGSAAGAHPREDICSPQGKPSSPGDSLPSVHIGSGFPRGGSSQRDPVSVEQACGFTGKQSTRNQKPRTASDSMCPRNGARPLTQQAADAQAPSGTVLLNGSAWAPGSRGLPGPPSGSGAEHGRAVSQLSVGQCVSLGSKDTPQPLPSNAHDTDGAPPLSIFGPKKKFRPVVQRPAPEDTSLHSALMQAIVSAGGTHTLRKTAELNVEPKKPSYTEAESERSALLAAIRGHSGSRSLRKVSSSASEELQILRDATRSAAGPGDPWREGPGPPPPPALPASRALSAAGAASRSNTGTLDNPVDARQALMDAIRSGTGAARLKKVPLLV